VLEAEAVVQSDPNNASSWFELGVKQQENEREDQAIQALEMAVSLNPTYLDAWLALAVSHSNENNREASLAAIRLWVNANKPYAQAVKAHESLNEEAIVLARMGGMKEKQNELVECLMTMARMSPHEGIDADIQIALGVLLNMSEVCFSMDVSQSFIQANPPL
jgi:peroxin-5